MQLKRHKGILSFFVILASWLVFTTAHAASSDPVGMLREVADNMIKGLKANEATLKTKPQVVYRLANQYVVPNAALPEMSKRVVPPATWNSATPAQRAQFEKEFTRTLIRTYASSLTAYKDQTVQFFPVRSSEGNTVEVSSEINSSENSPISVTYRLIRAGNGWRLIDLSVEGVDMLESFRAQFADILAQGSMVELLKRMSAHNNR